MKKSFSKLIVCVCLLLIYGTILQTCNARHASNAPKISAKSITKSRPPKSSPKSSPKSPSKPSSPSSPFKPSAPSSTSYSNEGSWKAPSFSNSDYGYGFNTPKKPTSSPSTSNSYGIPNFSVSGTSSSNKQNTPSPVSNSHTNPIGFENYQRNSMSTPSPVSNSHTNPIGFENYQRNSLSNRTNAVQPFNFNPSVSGTNSSNKFVSSYPASTSHSNATLFGTGISNHQQSGMSNFTNTLHPSNSNHSVFATNSSNKFVTSPGFSTSYNNATMLGTGVWNHQPSGASNFTNTFLPFNSNYSAFATNSGNKFWIPSPISTSYDTINVFPRLTGSYQTYPYYYYYYHQPHYYPRHYYRSTYPVTVIRNSSPKYFYPITQQNWNEIPEKCIMQRGPLSPTIPASFPEVSFNNTIELLAKNSKTYSNNLESKTHDAKMTTYADEGKPWLAALGFRNTNLSAENIDSYEIEWRCGGSLVHSEYILTAAHCFYVPGLTLSVVRLGAIDLVHEKNNSPKPLDVDVENATIIIHPCFHSFLLTNDIALIKLKSKINDRRPINLPFTLTSLHTVMDPVRMWGWGPTFEKGNNTALRFVDMHLLPLEKCYSVRNITDGEICAGMGVGGRNSCQGDSGGPLTWRESVGSPEYLLGVISTGGADCRKPNVANVYTNVMKYWKWMNCHFTKNTSCKQ